MDFPTRIDKLRALAAKDPAAYTQAVLRLSHEIDAQEAHEHMVSTAPPAMVLVPSPGDSVAVGGKTYPDMSVQPAAPPDSPPGPSPLRRALNTLLGLDPKTSRAELLLGPMMRGELTLPGVRSLDADGRVDDGWSFISTSPYQPMHSVRTAAERLRGIHAPVMGVDPADHLTPGGVSAGIAALLGRGLREPGVRLMSEATFRESAGQDAVIEPAPNRHAKRIKTDEQAIAASIARAERKSARRRAAGELCRTRCQRHVDAASGLLQRAAATGDEAAYQAALRRASVRINVARDVALSTYGPGWLSRGLGEMLALVRGQFGQSVHFAHLHWPAMSTPPSDLLYAQLRSLLTQPLRGDQPVGDDDGTPHP